MLQFVVRIVAIALAVFVMPAALGAEQPRKGAPQVGTSMPRVPEGFTVEIAAAPPLVGYPMMACLDDRGRLFISESDGRNMQKDELLASHSRLIRLLEDTDGDGVFDKSTVFADDMVMPEGALWLNNALYVLSAPYLWRLEDSDGDGKADKREKIVGEFQIDGRPNQHGPYVDPCGRLYMSGGIFGYDLIGKDGTRSGAGSCAGVFSCWPDGSGVEIVGHAGINPVEVAFSEEGEMFSTCAIFDNDGGRHDALIHWIRGGLGRQLWGAPLLKQTRQRLPALSRWGQVAPAGLARYRSTALGPDFQDNYFSCHFNTHKVVRTKIVRHGATFTSQDSDFLISDDIDFHPTDVMEDADGSLLVVNTGGWLSFGCPTSKIAKPNILGAIYRVRRNNMAGPQDPRGQTIDWRNASAEQLVALLGDPRPAVRDRALATLVSRGDAAIPMLQKAMGPSSPEQVRRNAVWACSRIRSAPAQECIRTALRDASSSVRHAAAYSAGTLGDQAAADGLIGLLTDPEVSVRRVAATSLGRITDRRAAPALLNLLSAAPDTYLRHAAIYSLIEINDPVAVSHELTNPNLDIREGALIALDQMRGGTLQARQVLALLSTNQPSLRQAALEIVARRPQWMVEIEATLRNTLLKSPRTREDDELVAVILSSFSRSEAIQQGVELALSSTDTPVSTRRAILKALAESDLRSLPARFVKPLGAILRGKDPALLESVVDVLRQKDTDQLDEALLDIGRHPSHGLSVRLTALMIVARHGRPLNPQSFQLLIQTIRGDNLPVDRLLAAKALTTASLSGHQLLELADLLGVTGPLELPLLISRIEHDAWPTVVNIDAQTTDGRLFVGSAAVPDERMGATAIWNAWNPLIAGDRVNLVASDGTPTNVALGSVRGAKLYGNVSNQFDRLIGDFVYNGLKDGGGRHQSFVTTFVLSGLTPGVPCTLCYYGSAQPKDPRRGATVTLTDAGGSQSRQIDGMGPEVTHYQEGKSHAIFAKVMPRSDGTIEISWTAPQHDVAGNFGIFNGLSLVISNPDFGRDARTGHRVFQSLAGSRALESILPERLERLARRYPPEVVDASAPLLERMRLQRKDQTKRLAEFVVQTAGGDAGRGRTVFFGNRAGCSSCHSVEGRGGNVGPDLSRLGKIRTERDLLESIIYPSATIVNGFESFSIATKDGRVFTGVIGRQTSDTIYLRQAGAPDIRIDRSDIESMTPSTLSIMPQGLEKAIDGEELRDLVAFLKSLD